MRDIKSELNKELEDLLDKKMNLSAFIGTEIFNKLPTVQKSLLVVQKDSMETYATCLYERINNL
tara:strand:- start:302 stop:493 length:192 start_codon:yes stop_codon:yes gene_type:complete